METLSYCLQSNEAKYFNFYNDSSSEDAVLCAHMALPVGANTCTLCVYCEFLAYCLMCLELHYVTVQQLQPHILHLILLKFWAHVCLLFSYPYII